MTRKWEPVKMARNQKMARQPNPWVRPPPMTGPRLVAKSVLLGVRDCP
jgi:hypothetical protein